MVERFAMKPATMVYEFCRRYNICTRCYTRFTNGKSQCKQCLKRGVDYKRKQRATHRSKRERGRYGVKP